jgi:hypothetical protein
MADTRIVTGVDATVRALKGMVKEDAPKIDEGLQKVGDSLLKKMMKYVPRETGALADSHEVTVTGKGFAAKLDIEAGGSDAPYAGFVHENLRARHDPPTCAQWMARAVREMRGTMASIMGRHLEAGARASFGGEEKA